MVFLIQATCFDLDHRIVYVSGKRYLRMKSNLSRLDVWVLGALVLMYSILILYRLAPAFFPEGSDMLGQLDSFMDYAGPICLTVTMIIGVIYLLHRGTPGDFYRYYMYTMFGYGFSAGVVRLYSGGFALWEVLTFICGSLLAAVMVIVLEQKREQSLVEI